jgi:hypothetical protein
MPRYQTYPTDENNQPIDTPGWRNADNIKDTASPRDELLIRAIREWDTDPEQLTAALAAGEDINSTDRVRGTPAGTAHGRPWPSRRAARRSRPPGAPVLSLGSRL